MVQLLLSVLPGSTFVIPQVLGTATADPTECDFQDFPVLDSGGEKIGILTFAVKKVASGAPQRMTMANEDAPARQSRTSRAAGSKAGQSNEHLPGPIIRVDKVIDIPSDLASRKSFVIKAGWSEAASKLKIHTQPRATKARGEGKFACVIQQNLKLHGVGKRLTLALFEEDSSKSCGEAFVDDYMSKLKAFTSVELKDKNGARIGMVNIK